jgi:hypothetical protein
MIKSEWKRLMKEHEDFKESVIRRTVGANPPQMPMM